MVITGDRRGGVFCGVIGHQSQFSLGHCCNCTASCEAHPPLVQVVPAVVVPVTCQITGYDNLNVYPITVLTPGPFEPGHRV